jgi:FkbM family methyltransferase
MQHQLDTSMNWGSYLPGGMDKFLMLFRQAGLAHGPVKNLLTRLWLSRHPDAPVDIRYQGVKYRLYPSDNVTDQKILFGSRKRDQVELEALRKVVCNGGIFIDIGANIGYYSLMAACFGATRILAIEPNPHALERLVFNIAANGYDDRITVLPVALGDAAGQATLFIPEQGDIGGGRISDHRIEGRQVTVAVQPLTAILADQGIVRIDALKIDVEGMEDAVLFPFFEHAPRTLWPGLVVIEHSSGKDWKRDILSWLLANGYSATLQTRSNMVLQLTGGTDRPGRDSPA